MTEERKGDDAYSRDWRTRLPWLKLKTRAWITWNMPAAVNFKSFMLRTEKVRMELGKGNINGGGGLLEALEGPAGFDNGDNKRDRGVAEGIV